MINMFGRNFEELGTQESGIILKGKIKVQWGNTFVDLLDENGKISGLAELEARIAKLEELNN